MEYTRGYKSSMSKDKEKQFRETFFIRSLYQSLFWTFLYLTSIYVSLLWFYNSYDQFSLECCVVFILLLIFLARQMRALENVVHFGSHNNFSYNQKLNDNIVNFLAAWPLLSEIKTYRKFHSIHHSQYGSVKDPCKQRFELMEQGNLNVSSSSNSLNYVIRCLPTYMIHYYSDVGYKSKQIVTFFIWHAAVFLVLSLLSSLYFATFAALSWAVAMFIILPVIRMIAEFSEHDYERGDSIYETTFSNIGIVHHVLFHPAGDAYHILHHLYPAVPWWKQSAAHRFLMCHDLNYRVALHRKELFGDVASFKKIELEN